MRSLVFSSNGRDMMGNKLAHICVCACGSELDYRMTDACVSYFHVCEEGRAQLTQLFFFACFLAISITIQALHKG